VGYQVALFIHDVGRATDVYCKLLVGVNLFVDLPKSLGYSMWHTLNLLPTFAYAWHILLIGTVGLHTTCPGAELKSSCVANDMNRDRWVLRHLFVCKSNAVAMQKIVPLFDSDCWLMREK
jgi:hypothetical protein